MAFLRDDENENITQGGQMAGGTTLAGYKNNTQTPQNMQTGMSTNLDRYIEKNRPQTAQMAEKAYGGVGKEREALQNEIGEGSAEQQNRLNALKNYQNALNAYNPANPDQMYTPLQTNTTPRQDNAKEKQTAPRTVTTPTTPVNIFDYKMPTYTQDTLKQADISNKVQQFQGMFGQDRGQARAEALRRIQGNTAPSGVTQLNQMLLKNDPYARQQFALGQAQLPQLQTAFDKYRTLNEGYEPELANTQSALASAKARYDAYQAQKAAEAEQAKMFAQQADNTQEDIPIVQGKVDPNAARDNTARRILAAALTSGATENTSTPGRIAAGIATGGASELISGQAGDWIDKKVRSTDAWKNRRK